MERIKPKLHKVTLVDRTFWRAILPLAVPIALQNLLMTSFRLVDTLMIGRLGDTSIAAVGLAGQASFLIELIVFGLSSGSSVFIAQYHGAGNRRGVQRSFGAALLFAVPLGIVFTALCFSFPERVMLLLTDEQPLIEAGAQYLTYACFSFFGICIYTPLCVVLRSTEQVRLPMISSIVASLANVALNYIFIFGAFGLPAMGVAGAGLATAISSLMNPAIILILSIKEKNIIISPLKELLDVKGFLGPFWKRVFPVLFNELIWSLSIVGVNMVFGRMGQDNYAALTVFRTVENIVFVFFVGICNACNILVGKRIGAGEIDEGVSYARRFLRLVPIFGVILGLIVFLLREPVVGLFDLSETAHRTAVILLIVYSIEVGIRNVPYLTVVGVFRAGGDTRIGLLGDGVVQYAVLLPLVYICGLVLRLPFLETYIIMICADDLLKCLIYLPHFYSMKWIKPVTEPAKQEIAGGETTV